MRKLIVAESAGFCFGVERSVRLTEDALKEGPCFCLGQLITTMRCRPPGGEGAARDRLAGGSAGGGESLSARTAQAARP
jgi:hypothetical protein